MLSRIYLVMIPMDGDRRKPNGDAWLPWIRTGLWCWRCTARMCLSPKRVSTCWSRLNDPGMALSAMAVVEHVARALASLG